MHCCLLEKEAHHEAVKLAADIEAAWKAVNRAHNDSKNRKEADRILELAWNRRTQIVAKP